MDELELAMQEEEFTLVDNHESPKIILFGKQIMGGHTENGEYIEDIQFCIAQTWENDRKDFSMHHIHCYVNVKSWLDTNTTGGYAYYLDLFKSRDLKGKESA